MRIIAGRHRGTQIFAPRGDDTRPTQDRVKESLFNIIQNYVPEAVVLDLFAGSGALSFESISRGAQEASLVDIDREAANCIKRNAQKLGLMDCIHFYKCEWKQAIKQMSGKSKRFDLVFLDPPYRMTDLSIYCYALASADLLADGAMMVLEHREGVVPALDERFEQVNERKYGDSGIHFYVFKREEGI